jgi:hypothetical protein
MRFPVEVNLEDCQQTQAHFAITVATCFQLVMRHFAASPTSETRRCVAIAEREPRCFMIIRRCMASWALIWLKLGTFTA